jgi:hypothetical protein
MPDAQTQLDSLVAALRKVDEGSVVRKLAAGAEDSGIDRGGRVTELYRTIVADPPWPICGDSKAPLRSRYAGRRRAIRGIFLQI